MAEEMRSPIESGCPDAFQYMHPVMRKNYGQWAYHEDPQPGVLEIVFAGDWLLRNAPPGVAPVLQDIEQNPDLRRLRFDASGLGDWDSGLVTAALVVATAARDRGLEVDAEGLPAGARRLLALALAVPEREDARRPDRARGMLHSVGERSIETWGHARDLSAFVGELVLSFGRFLRGKATWLRSDLWTHIQEAGAEALPIVSLISFLIGMIFAFVGAFQLERFGAGIFTADLVAIGMVREMSAIMTAIIMAGRTGASYAAQIGTMKVNEEVDAMITLGIDPVDFLVTPRVIALVLMMPLLTLYSSLMGILGGMVMASAQLDIAYTTFIDRLSVALTLESFLVGVGKAPVFAAVIAVIGCQQGFQVSGSADHRVLTETAFRLQGVRPAGFCFPPTALFRIWSPWILI